MRTSDRSKGLDSFDVVHDALCAELLFGDGILAKTMYEGTLPRDQKWTMRPKSARGELEAPVWTSWPGRKQDGVTRTLPSAWIDYLWRATYERPSHGSHKAERAAILFVEVKSRLGNTGATLRQLRLYQHLLGEGAVGVLMAPQAEIERKPLLVSVIRRHGFLVCNLDLPGDR